MSEHLIEDCLVLIKPDAMARRLTGKLITRLEEKELDIVALKLLSLDEQMAADLYQPHQGKYFYPRLVRFISSGPITAMICRGRQAIARIRQIVGEADPEKSAPGTIRSDFTCHQTYNLIHASDTCLAATREISIFFKPEEIFDPITPRFPWHAYPELTEP